MTNILPLVFQPGDKKRPDYSHSQKTLPVVSMPTKNGGPSVAYRMQEQAGRGWYLDTIGEVTTLNGVDTWWMCSESVLTTTTSWERMGSLSNRCNWIKPRDFSSSCLICRQQRFLGWPDGIQEGSSVDNWRHLVWSTQNCKWFPNKKVGYLFAVHRSSFCERG